MSRQAIKAINWAAIAERIPASEKNMLATFRTKSDQYLRRMMANPETSPKIDWGYYKKHIAAPGLVDSFQKQYEAMSVPYPADKYTAQIEEDRKKVQVEIASFIERSNAAIAKHEAEITKIKGMIPFAEMTMEDARELYPEHGFQSENAKFWPHTPEAQEERGAAKSGASH